jgi:O-antigen/teichoic acid export membrane protein
MRIGNAAIYFINNQGRNRQTVTTDILRFAILLAFFLVPVLILVLQIESYFESLSMELMTALVVLGMSKLIIATQLPLLISSMQIARYVVGMVIPNLIVVTLATIGFYTGLLDLSIAVSITAFGLAVGALVATMFNFKDYRSLHRSSIRTIAPLLRYGAIINLSYVIMLLGNEGSLLLLHYLARSFEDVGFYRIALRISSVVMMVTGAIGPLLYAKFAASDPKTRNDHVERTCRVYWLVLVGWVVILNLLAEPILRILYGVDYVAATPVLRFMLFGISALAASSPVFQMLYSNGGAWWVSGVHGMNAAILATLMYLFVPDYGAFGAGVAFAVSNAIGLSIAYAVAHFRFGLDIRKCLIVLPADIRFAVNSFRNPTQSG